MYKVILAGMENWKSADPEKAQQDDKSNLVHMQGRSSTFEAVGDQIFGLVYQDVVKVKRSVEVFQWIEKEKKEGDGDNERVITYYEKEWCSTKHDQNSFKRQDFCEDGSQRNPENWPCESDEFVVG